MTTGKRSQPAARRRGELHRANGDRQVAQAMGARRRLNALPFRAGLRSVWREAAIRRLSSAITGPSGGSSVDRAAIARGHATSRPRLTHLAS
jgi:hypothetical protein